MAKFIFIILLFAGIAANAQTYLGYNKEAILESAKLDYKKREVRQEILNDSISVIKIKNDYENIFFYLVDDRCVKFTVTKPYSCNCLSSDIMTYNSQLVSIGKFTWRSEDASKIYQIKLNKKSYEVIIIDNHLNPDLISLTN